MSARSMGNAIDDLHDALVKIEDDGELFLDEQCMADIFHKSMKTNRTNEGH